MCNDRVQAAPPSPHNRTPNHIHRLPTVARIHLQPVTGARIVLRRPAQDVDRRVGSIQAARRNELFQQRQRRDQPDTKKPRLPWLNLAEGSHH